MILKCPTTNSTILDQCPPCASLVVSDDFLAFLHWKSVDGLCIGPDGCDIRNINSSLLHNFALSRRLRTAASWFQRSTQHRWTKHSKEIDHILIRTRWRILQNLRVSRSVEFFAANQGFVVTFMLHIKTRRMSRSEWLQFFRCSSRSQVWCNACTSHLQVTGAFVTRYYICKSAFPVCESELIR